MDKCEQCHCEIKPREGVELVVDGRHIPLCGKCYNQRAAEYAGVDFTHISFEPLTFADVGGVDHTFDFTTHLFGTRVIIEAFERMQDDDDKGYRFCVLGDAEEGVSNFELFAQLVARIKRALARKHIERGGDGCRRITDEGVVRGHITSDTRTGSRLPVLVIDGQEVPWDELGDMVMTYEGFHFKLQIVDKSQEI